MATQTNQNGSYNYIHEATELDPLRGSKAEEIGNRTCAQKCVYVLKNVTYEPTMFLFVVSAVLSVMTTQNLYLEKACRVSLNFTEEICDSLRFQNVENQNEYEKQAQKLMASALATKTYMTATIPCLFSFFAGAWSDKTGQRKILVIIPLVGQILACFNNMLNKYFFYELSLEFLVVSEGLLEGFTGSWCIMFLSIFAYISTISTNETRTFRLGLVNFSLTVAFPIGSGMSGIVLRSWDYYGTYSIVASLHLINLFYSSVFVKNPERTSAQKKVI